MASSDPKFNQITTESQENLEMYMEEDNGNISSSEFSTTDSESTNSPIVKKKATKTNITKETQINDNGLPQGLIQPPTKEELGAFVIQLDQTHWQHELQVLSAMSVNRILKVTANGTLLNGKRIIRPQDTATQLWLQSCTSVSGKPVKFTQLVKNTSVTAVLVNVHPFISMEALLTDERITTAERILTFNSETRIMEPSRSVKINLSMKSVPTEMRINFLGKFFVRPFVTKPVRCYRCQRFGHLAAACLAKKERCSMCSGHHRTQQCLGKIQNSESVDLKCANCGEKHSANSNHCSVLREKMQRKMNNAMSRILATKQSPPPPVTSTAFPATLSGDIDTRKRVMSDNSVRGVNNYAAAAAKHHVPRSVVLAARGTSKFAASSIKSTVSLMHGSKDNSTEQQSIKMDHRRKRTAAQALTTPATKKPTASEATAQENTTPEPAASKTTVLESTVSETTALKTGNQLPTSAETYDRIFSVLMTQMEQLRPLLAIQDFGAKKIVRKMVTSIRELLDDLVELQSN